MTRLDVSYATKEQFSAHELQAASPLHVLAVTDGPLRYVQFAYEDDPSELTEDVFLDACYHSSSLEIIQYLKERAPPEYYTPEKIAPIILRRIVLSSDMDGLYDLNIKILSKLFPEAMVYSEEPDSYLGSPLDRALWGGDLSDELVEDVVKRIPRTIKGFDLPPSFENQMLKTIATTLAKSEIEFFSSDKHNWDLDEFVDFFTILLPGAKNLKTLKLRVPSKESPRQDLFASFPTDWFRTCELSSLSLTLGDDFGILPWLVHMRELKSLKLQIVSNLANQDSCKTICQVLAVGKLESLTVDVSEDESDGLFYSLLDAIGSCPPLSTFHLVGLTKASTPSNIDGYQNRMITMLNSNTSLKHVRIGTSASGIGVNGRDGQLYISVDTKKQKLIEYYATLNICGRGIARDSGKVSDLVKVLVKTPDNVWNFRHRLSTYFTPEQVLYGLLRESPGTWSANALGQDFFIKSQCRGLKRKASSSLLG